MSANTGKQQKRKVQALLVECTFDGCGGLFTSEHDAETHETRIHGVHPAKRVCSDDSDTTNDDLDISYSLSNSPAAPEPVKPVEPAEPVKPVKAPEPVPEEHVPEELEDASNDVEKFVQNIIDSAKSLDVVANIVANVVGEPAVEIESGSGTKTGRQALSPVKDHRTAAHVLEADHFVRSLWPFGSAPLNVPAPQDSPESRRARRKRLQDDGRYFSGCPRSAGFRRKTTCNSCWGGCTRRSTHGV